MANKSRTLRSKAKSKSSPTLPEIISLFSGAGGLDHGFKSAGFRINAAFDISEAAIETHKRNFPGSNSIADDLIKLGPQDEKQDIEPPRFHIGRVDDSGNYLKKTGDTYTSLPYSKSDKPDAAFRKLVDCVWDEIHKANPNPKLENIFDYYLRMVWFLALAIPLPYVDGHLFNQPISGWTKTFQLSNKPKGSAQTIEGSENQTIRSVLALSDPEDIGKFDVFLDELKLSRPIKYRGLPMSSHALRHPLVFIGKCNEAFSSIRKRKADCRNIRCSG